jgi:hypothetical protein
LAPYQVDRQLRAQVVDGQRRPGLQCRRADCGAGLGNAVSCTRSGSPASLAPYDVSATFGTFGRIEAIRARISGSPSGASRRASRASMFTTACHSHIASPGKIVGEDPDSLSNLHFLSSLLPLILCTLLILKMSWKKISIFYRVPPLAPLTACLTRQNSSARLVAGDHASRSPSRTYSLWTIR